ncbi:MAG: M20 family metallopeptidase [Chloroflexi bacterium]|nr:M20 family metallopeptidase [Chloroflexota bacterium]
MGEEQLASPLMEGKRLLEAINESEVIDFARAMIRIPSEVGHESRLAGFLADLFAGMGLRVQKRELSPNRLNVLGILEGKRRPEKIALLFHGHTDTIPVLGMKDPFSGDLVDGYIWGRGSVDQKGGLAAATMAIKALAEARVPLDESVAIAAVIDEESEHRGSMGLVEDGLQASWAIVTEPSDLKLVIGCKGTLPVKICVTGKTAHGSRPWLGINAIVKATRVIDKLCKVPLPSLHLPAVGEVRATLNIGLIEGGTAYNNVPDRCCLWLDRRMVPGETPAEVLAGMQGILDGLAAADAEFKASLEVARPDWRWEPIRERGLKPATIPADSPLISVLRRNHPLVVGEEAALAYSDGYMDMDFLINDLGIPTVNYGPGDTVLSHADDERLSVKQLLWATKVYALTALDLAQGRVHA